MCASKRAGFIILQLGSNAVVDGKTCRHIVRTPGNEMSSNRSSYLVLLCCVYAGSCACHSVYIFCPLESASESLHFRMWSDRCRKKTQLYTGKQ